MEYNCWIKNTENQRAQEEFLNYMDSQFGKRVYNDGDAVYNYNSSEIIIQGEGANGSLFLMIFPYLYGNKKLTMATTESEKQFLDLTLKLNLDKIKQSKFELEEIN